VALASRSQDHLDAGAAELTRDGSQVLTVPVDVRDPAAVDTMVETVVKATGRIDILVNNAAGNFICRAEDLSPNGWNAVIGIVLNGSFYCSRAVGRHMIARGGGGSIVSILATYAVDWQRRDDSFGVRQGRRHGDDADPRGGMGAASHPRQCRRARADSSRPAPRNSCGRRPRRLTAITQGVPLGRWGRAS
jgi:NAD(P)-dependent dehydrogenase (short-subunit alcohol dehydrogenase family)